MIHSLEELDGLTEHAHHADCSCDCECSLGRPECTHYDDDEVCDCEGDACYCLVDECDCTVDMSSAAFYFHELEKAGVG